MRRSSFLLFLFFLFGCLVKHNGRKMNVFVSEIICNTAGDDCGNRYKEIRPPKIVELLHNTADGDADSGKETEIHALKNEEHDLKHRTEIRSPFAAACK